jgi:ribosomal protein L7/L12
MNFKDLLDSRLEVQIKDLIKSGNPIEAIRIVQNELKIGLKNSKDLVDELTDQFDLNPKKTYL